MQNRRWNLHKVPVLRMKMRLAAEMDNFNPA
jgi:hypothetical protein